MNFHKMNFKLMKYDANKRTPTRMSFKKAYLRYLDESSLYTYERRSVLHSHIIQATWDELKFRMIFYTCFFTDLSANFWVKTMSLRSHQEVRYTREGGMQ